MGIFKKRRPALATVLDQPFSCRTCGHDEFWHREIKLNSTGMELFDLGWLNQSSRGLICARCGYVHEFVGDALQLWKNQREDAGEE